MKNEQNNKELESLTKRIRFKSLPFDEKQMSDRLSDRVKRPVIISYTGKENSAWKYLSIAASIALLLVTGILLTDKEPEQELVYYETIADSRCKNKNHIARQQYSLAKCKRLPALSERVQRTGPTG